MPLWAFHSEAEYVAEFSLFLELCVAVGGWGVGWGSGHWDRLLGMPLEQDVTQSLPGGFSHVGLGAG